MRGRITKGLGIVVVLCLFFGFLPVAEATKYTSLSLAEAIELSVQQNASHALFLWEQRLAEQRQTLKKQPQISAVTTPARISNGEIQPATGSLTMELALGEHLDLSGTVAIALDRSGVAVEPTGSLNLGYKFFAIPDQGEQAVPAEVGRLIRDNELVLQVVAAFVQLRQQLDLRDHAEEYLNYLELVLAAAQLTPDYDDLQLKKDVRNQVVKLSKIEEEIKQLQLQLGSLLGTGEPIDYDPLFRIMDFKVTLDEEKLRQEVFAFNPNLRQAEANLVRAQEKLDLERKTRGWDVQASGNVSLDLTWDVSLTANKILYPRNIILEELELGVARAEFDLEAQQDGLDNQLRSAIQTIETAQEQVHLKAEQLIEVKEDLAFRHRQYTAGLVTELQVTEATLLVHEAELSYANDQIQQARNILELWNLCGRDLQSAVYDVIN